MGCYAECRQFGHTYRSGCVHYADAPLEGWERRILSGDPAATVEFHLESGRTLKFENVNVDSIGPAAERPGVIGVEFDQYEDEKEIVHVPFVLWWEIHYS